MLLSAGSVRGSRRGGRPPARRQDAVAKPRARSRRKAAARPRPRSPASAPSSSPRRTSPLCAIRLFFQVGSVDDPDGQGGAGRAHRRHDRQGRQQDPHLRRAARRALSAGRRASRSTATRNRSCSRGPSTATTSRKFADLLAEQVLTPRFADDDFTRNKEDALDYVTKTLRGNADEDLGKQAMATVLYKGHPYGTPDAGDGRRPHRDHARRRAASSTPPTTRATG